MPDVKFLEEYGLYRKLACSVPKTLNNLPKPSINMSCLVCSGTRTFVITNEYWEGFGYSNYPSAGVVLHSQYKCFGCKTFERHFYIKISDDYDWIMKVGQFPAWEIVGDKNVEAMLGEHKSLLKKGLVSESQGYGIGAFGYYRRIVEEIIDELLTDIEDMLGEEDRKAYSDALASAKSTRVTSEKIELVQDLLPPILRPSGMNPLSLLHGVLSEGLHAESDERCLELAVEVREILVFLAAQIATTGKSARSFTDRMRSLLDKRDRAIKKG